MINYRLMPLQEVKRPSGAFTKSAIYRNMREGRFPTPIKIGGGPCAGGPTKWSNMWKAGPGQPAKARRASCLNEKRPRAGISGAGTTVKPMDRESNTPAADKQRPQGVIRLPAVPGWPGRQAAHPTTWTRARYGYHGPNLSDQELVAALVEDYNRTLRNIMDTGPVGPENLTFEQLHLPVTDAPIERRYRPS